MNDEFTRSKPRFRKESGDAPVPAWLEAPNIPEDIEAERSLLATCCAPGAGLESKEALLFLQERDFHHKGYKAVFGAARSLAEKSIEISSLTLKDAMTGEQTLGQIGGYPGLVEVLQSEDVEHPMILAHTLRRKRLLRDFIQIGAKIARSASLEEFSPDELVSRSFQAIMHLSQGSTATKGLRDAGEISVEVVASSEAAALSPDGNMGVRTHMSRFDTMTMGFQPGNLIVVAARPGIGKTALTLNWLLRSAEFYGTSGGFFSLEMSEAEVVMRLMAIQAKFHPKNVGKDGRYTIDQAMEKVRSSSDWLYQRGLYVNDNATITVPQIRAIVEQRQAQLPADRKMKWVFVDYLQLLSSPDDGSKNKNDATRVGEMSRGLKLMAKDLKIPVIVMSQLNREVEHRQSGRPQLSDLRDSGAIEQDADMVVFIHGKTTPGPDGVVDPSRELIVAKQRNGPTGLIPLQYEGESFGFFELVRETDPYAGSVSRPPDMMSGAAPFDLEAMGIPS